MVIVMGLHHMLIVSLVRHCSYFSIKNKINNNNNTNIIIIIIIIIICEEEEEEEEEEERLKFLGNWHYYILLT